MYPDAAVLSAIGVQGALRVIEMALHLFAPLFPQQAIVQNNSSFDFIIVGAGSAGCVLARRLSDNENFNVLLIEAGDNPALEEMLPGLGTLYAHRTQFDWNYTSYDDTYTYQCYKNNVYRTIRGHGIGGSSAINYMLYVRGDPVNYKQWADISKDPTWDYDNVLPYFIKSERNEDQEILNSKYREFHGTKGELGVNRFPDMANLKYFKALDEVGYKTVLDTNSNYTLGFTFPMYDISQGKRQSSCYCFVSPVQNRKNLHVLRNTKATKIIFDNKRATGVEIITANNEKMFLSAKLEVILSAGAFNSPQLLMLSGIGPKEHLESHNIKTIVDLPVGYNLQDHVGVTIAHKTEKLNSTDPPFDFSRPPVNFINGFVSLNESQNYPDSQFILLPSRNAESILSFFAYPLYMDDFISQAAYEANKEHEILLAFIFNMRAYSRGRIMLDSTNINDQPKIVLGAFSDKRDLENIKRYVKHYLRIEHSSYFRNVNANRIDLAGERCKGFTKNSDEYWDCYVLCLMISIHHYSGTCAMGSVVDSNLRVYNVTGLRVIDASIFPTLPSGNTNAPTMMVAEKAADMIKDDYSTY